ncbi:hypothetical protein GCM10008018_45340 [Paenibacillus marchantiophytorum]|uniref:Integrase catalytic domain-containing protein n=1 Tax=Paenibacillus marchantiophytorum TaxID=1619310 RepID=A0ABQ1EYZ0_9BACL|nr:hypothetical protein GCM10008018_45340 [Paenibacillus marchantiophytorum]
MNLVLQSKSGEERILYIAPDKSYVYTISLSEKDPLPTRMDFSKLVDDLNNGYYTKSENDPYAILMNPTAKYLEKHGSGVDAKWNLIKDIVENEPAIYDRVLRGEVMKELIERTKKSKTLIYRYLRFYWTGGKMKNALLSHYFKCGRPMKPGERKNIVNKVGRRSILAIANENSPEYLGVVIKKEDRVKMSASLAEWYKKNKRNSLEFVHEQMWHHHYLEKVFEGGELKEVPLPSYKVPTIDQLRYYYEQTEDYKKVLIAREGMRNYNLKYRPVLGNATRRAAGPGSIYEIDATVGDIYLISQVDRTKVIGRPVIYLVIDVFSRMIAGFYVGLEGPSWQGAMMALENAAINKVEFCAEYDIPIEDSQWPCRHMPEVLIGDRGELESKRADSITQFLGVVVKNEPPYRADWKGIVESSFKTVSTTIKKWAPGAVFPDFKQRGGKDYVLDAKLSLCGFIKMMIQFILYHNNNKVIKDYPIDTSMVPESVLPVPIQLWNWGIQNRSGHLKTFSRDIIRLNLLPSKKITTTRLGITFEGIHYKCDTLEKAGWFVKGDSRSAIMAYDRRSMNFIYVKTSDGLDYYKCSLQEKSDRFMDLSLEEIKMLQHEEKLALANYKDSQNLAKYKMNQEFKKIVQGEIDLSNQARERVDMTNREFKANTQENRAVARKVVQTNQAFDLGTESNQQIFVENHTHSEYIADDEEGEVKGMSLLDKLKRRKNKDSESGVENNDEE